MGERTIEVSIEQFSFWQAQMAHASARATNNPEHNGNAVYRAHEQMKQELTEVYHE